MTTPDEGRDGQAEWEHELLMRQLQDAQDVKREQDKARAELTGDDNAKE